MHFLPALFHVQITNKLFVFFYFYWYNVCDEGLGFFFSFSFKVSILTQGIPIEKQIP